MRERGDDLREMRHTARARHMHDERMIARTAFSSKDFGNGHVVASVRAKAVNGLGWKGNELTRGKRLRGGSRIR